MARPPEFRIDPASFRQNPYPTYTRMRATAPVCYVPELDAILFTRRNDIFECEKNVDVFSSWQPKGLMTLLMGENMMRKDGEAHLSERRQMFPSVSPRTVRDHWVGMFRQHARRILETLEPRGKCDLVTDYAMPVSAEALKTITGLTQITAGELDAASQAMIDGCANYAGNPEVEARCHEATRFLDNAIDERLQSVRGNPDFSMVSVLSEAGQPLSSIHANIKLTISGGQNEPRDAIAGCAWALLNHPGQLDLVLRGDRTWLQAFEEYARWISPIGMSPRRVARSFNWNGLEFEPEERVFFMFGSANRDETVFEDPDRFDLSRDTSPSIAFGAGPHFCAGAAASRALIADVALPMLFEYLPDIRLAGNVPFEGWAFRGPVNMPVSWGNCP